MRYVVATLLLLLAAVIGERLPDLDQRTTLLLHRSIVTHSPFVPLALSLVALSIPNVPVRWFAIGICASVCVHLAFDLFPRGWMRFALVSLPFYGWTSPAVLAGLVGRQRSGLRVLGGAACQGLGDRTCPAGTGRGLPVCRTKRNRNLAARAGRHGCALVVLLFRRKSDQA